MSTATKLLAGLGLALLALLGAQTWRLARADRRVAELTAAPLKAAVDSARARVDTVTVTLQAADRVVTRTLRAVRVDTLVLAPRTPAETTTAVRQLPRLAIAHDSLQRACGDYQRACTAFREAVAVERAATTARIAALERSQRRRRWPVTLGLTGGVGVTSSRGVLHTGPTLAAGLTWTLF